MWKAYIRPDFKTLSSIFKNQIIKEPFTEEEYVELDETKGPEFYRAQINQLKDYSDYIKYYSCTVEIKDFRASGVYRLNGDEEVTAYVLSWPEDKEVSYEISIQSRSVEEGKVLLEEILSGSEKSLYNPITELSFAVPFSGNDDLER